MWKALIAGTAAGVIAGSSLLFAQQPPAPAAATPTGEQHDQDTGWQPSAEDDQDTGSRLQKITKKIVHLGGHRQKM